TRDFVEDFARELAAADHVVLAEIYAAREVPLAGVDSGILATALRSRGYEPVDYVPDRNRLVPHVAELCRAGDLVLGMGAGDIGEAVDELVLALAAKAGGGAKS
ncbi:MAG: UDP-N-acetylmuramate--L-alanine ligase, partial [Candidatus Latescibacterota bacterium]|nr:UDP-N-acetylmuramate--L-alanine ligase [Candidatus Latescibacterota bacterium]